MSATEKRSTDFKKMIKKDNLPKFLNKAYRFLKYRPRSEKEIVNYLKKKKATPLMVRRILAVLRKQNYLNDQEFVAWWLEQRSTFRPRGKMALRAELRQKGVDQSLVNQALIEIDELPLAMKVVAQQKKKIGQKIGKRVLKHKMAAALGRRGFAWGTINKVLEKTFSK